MGIYDEPYDITYLHDREDKGSSKDDDQGFIPQFLRKRSFVLAACVVVLFLGTGLLVISLQNSQDSRTKANEIENQKEVSLNATVICDKTTDSDKCTLSAITDDGKKYSIDESGSKSSGLKEGEKVNIEGIVQNTGGTQTLIVKKTTPITIPFYKTPTPPTDPNLTPTPTVIQGDPIAPTPTPQVLKNNTPTSGADYQTITYVIQNKDSLNGQTINVQGYLVGGYIGVPGCTFEPNCNHSQFILSDFNSPNRDTSFDILYIGGTDDKEGEYEAGQNFYSTVKVISEGDTVYIEKIN